jgi:pimeloyl-ACP methyl ester carboxylesterase
MGAVAMIFAAAEDPRIEALHLDAAYARTRDIAEVLVPPLPPGLWHLAWGTGLLCGSMESGINLWSFDARPALAQVAPRPVMLVHGTADRLIPIAQGRMLYAAAGAPKFWQEIEGADHCMTVSADTPHYQQRMLAFFERMAFAGRPAEAPPGE